MGDVVAPHIYMCHCIPLGNYMGDVVVTYIYMYHFIPLGN